MKKKYTLTLAQLPQLIEDVLRVASHHSVIILRGDLAAGKTTFVKALAQTLQITDDVTSPTFSLQQCYGDKLYHYDLYNHGLEHFLSMGMLEELEKEGLHLIEWGDDTLIEMLTSVGIETLSIEIKKISNDAREYTLCTY